MAWLGPRSGIQWYVYLLRSEKIPHLYTGITTDPERRLARHNNGTGAKFTRGRGPWSIAYLEPTMDHRDALRREREIKGWSRAEKLELIKRPSADPVSASAPPVRQRSRTR